MDYVIRKITTKVQICLFSHYLIKTFDSSEDFTKINYLNFKQSIDNQFDINFI